MTPPPESVLEAFGLKDRVLERLRGGEERTWVAGDAVLKPVPNTEEAIWVAEVLEDLPAVGFRVPRPLRSLDADWVVGGWSAWGRVEGEHNLTSKWRDVIAVGNLFHAQLRDVPKPGFLDTRQSPWDDGDRAAWGEESIVLESKRLGRLVERFQAVLRPVELHAQLIHGDLSGNVLFAGGLPPAVIDFSPYWRPAGFGLAIVVVDAIAWYGADESLLDSVHTEAMNQLLVRAGIYRIVTADRFARSRSPKYAEANVAAYEQLAELVERLANA